VRVLRRTRAALAAVLLGAAVTQAARADEPAGPASSTTAVSTTTTSPSTTKSLARWARSASAISGYVPVTCCWLRVISRS